MIGLLIYTLIFALIYLAYRWIKQRIYTYRNLGPLDNTVEQYLFLAGLFVFLFISTWRFTVVSPSVIGGSYYGSNGYWVPFSEILEYNRLNAFLQYVSGDAGPNLSQLTGTYLTTFLQSTLVLLPLSLSLFAAYKSPRKRFTWVFITVMISYFYSGEVHIGTTVVQIIVLFGLTYLANWLIERLLQVVFKGHNSQMLKWPGALRWGLIAILVLAVLFTSEIRFADDSFASEYTSPEIIEFEAPLVSKGEVGITFLSAKLKSDHTEIELDYRLDKVPKLDMPYEYELMHFSLDLQAGETRYTYDTTASTHQIEELGENIDSISIQDIDLYSPRPKSIFPLTIYGVHEISYRIVDPDLLDQISYELHGWVKDEPYTCYRISYTVPKVAEFDLHWNISLDYKDLLSEKGGMISVRDSGKRVLEETETTITYEVDKYFYGRDPSDIEILGPKVRHVRYEMTFSDRPDDPILHFDDYTTILQ